MRFTFGVRANVPFGVRPEPGDFHHTKSLLTSQQSLVVFISQSVRVLLAVGMPYRWWCFDGSGAALNRST